MSVLGSHVLYVNLLNYIIHKQLQNNNNQNQSLNTLNTSFHAELCDIADMVIKKRKRFNLFVSVDI